MFQGFTEETIDFLWGIRFHNEKPWFEAHKDDYRVHLLEPMRALANEVYDRFTATHGDLDLMCRVSRIYRDARRRGGHGPYKDRLWCSIERATENWIGQPVYWFELSPEGYFYGLGYYSAPAVTMAKFRKRLENRPQDFAPLARAFEKQKTFLLEGEDYKRPKGEPPTPLLRPWYNKKTFSLACNCTHDDAAFSHALADRILAGYEQLFPFYRFLMQLEADPDPRAEY